jgi:prolyl-tRNA synthetase
MRLSQYFLPTLRETPKEAQIVSHRLMLRAGMIQQSSAGIYSWLPLGLKVMRKIEQIVREEQNRAGAVELLMPTIQPAELWQESGRYDDYGLEMLRIKDRHDRDMLFGPTNEEQITDIFRTHVKSYRALPLNLYHIQWKFRDEVRPRFGIMRGREFLMKDAYSFALNAEAARTEYNKMFVSYLLTFKRLGLTAIPMEAETGPIGGDMSHEFVILADTGESEVFCHKDWLNYSLDAGEVDYQADLQPIVDRFTSLYAVTDEKHDASTCPVKADDLVTTRGIEVGHIFYFGDKYSAPMGAMVTDDKGKSSAPHMGSYGIGVSRLVGGIIEASHDDKGIIWPESVAPFDVAVVNLKPGHDECDAAVEDLYNRLQNSGFDVLMDDSADSAGAKLNTMDLIGIPRQIIIGPRSMANGEVEFKIRKTGASQTLSPDAAFNAIMETR